jgi:hypothetical protein
MRYATGVLGAGGAASPLVGCAGVGAAAFTEADLRPLSRSGMRLWISLTWRKLVACPLSSVCRKVHGRGLCRVVSQPSSEVLHEQLGGR